MKVEVDADELAELRSELKRLRERENELLACNSRLVLERQQRSKEAPQTIRISEDQIKGWFDNAAEILAEKSDADEPGKTP